MAKRRKRRVAHLAREQRRAPDGTFRGAGSPHLGGYLITAGPRKGRRSRVPLDWVRGYTRSDGVRVRGHYRIVQPRRRPAAQRGRRRRAEAERGNPPRPVALAEMTTDERYEIHVEAKRLARALSPGFQRLAGETVRAASIRLRDWFASPETLEEASAYLLLLADLVDQ